MTDIYKMTVDLNVLDQLGINLCGNNLDVMAATVRGGHGHLKDRSRR